MGSKGGGRSAIVGPIKMRLGAPTGMTTTPGSKRLALSWSEGTGAIRHTLHFGPEYGHGRGRRRCGDLGRGPVEGVGGREPHGHDGLAHHHWPYPRHGLPGQGCTGATPMAAAPGRTPSARRPPRSASRRRRRRSPRARPATFTYRFSAAAPDGGVAFNVSHAFPGASPASAADLASSEPAPDTLTVAKGETSATLSVWTGYDRLIEDDETVTVTLTPTGANAAGALPAHRDGGVLHSPYTSH